MAQPTPPASADIEQGQRGPGAPRRWWTVPPPSRTQSLLAALALAVVLLVITQQSLAPATGRPSLPQIDKVQHLAAYGVVAGLGAFAFRGQLLVALMLAVIWGAGVEVAQGVMELGREMSAGDLLANVAGAGLGTWVGAWILRRRSGASPRA